ncbi:MAG: DUF1629 domain-containing protein [Pseudomonadota bacterium]
MNDYVWHSHVMLSDKPGTVPLRGINYHEDERGKEYLEMLDAYEQGAPIQAADLPSHVCFRRGQVRKQLNYLNAADLWVLNAEVAEIFRSFDLGAGGLYPVGLLGVDRKTPVEGEHYILVFGNRKDTIDYEKSKLRPGMDPRRLKPPEEGDDGKLVFKREALRGPDIWLEENLRRAVFFSGPLGDALKKAKKHSRFRIGKCSVQVGCPSFTGP